MTISNENYKNTYTLNESTTSFPYTFNISANSDLRARVYNTDTGAFTTLTLDSDYTVTGAGDEGGGTVTYAGATSYDSTYELVLDRYVPYTQTTDLINNDNSASFNETLENTFDRLVILIQQLLGETGRSLKFDASVTEIDDIAALTAGYLYWNGTSVDIDDAVETTTGAYPGTITAGVDASKSASPSRNDIYLAYDTNILYKCITNGSWTNVWVLGDTTATSLTVGDIDSSGDVTISGGVTIGTSLSVVTGLTITSILDEDDMASDSDTALATQQSIKAYIASVTGLSTGVYTGDGTESQAITGIGFQPRYVKIFPRETTNVQINIIETTDTINDDHASGASAEHENSTAGGHEINLNRIRSLDSDGFTVSDGASDTDPNKNGKTYNYLCLK